MRVHPRTDSSDGRPQSGGRSSDCVEQLDLWCRNGEHSVTGPGPRTDEFLASRHVRMFVVRHGCAGDKQAWRGDDAERPLDPGGQQQADALCRLFDTVEPRRLVASPTARCLQTLQPLALRNALPIEAAGLLSPDGSIARLLDVEGHALDGAVLCTHGELMESVLATVRQQRVPVQAERDDDDWLLAKGSSWLLELTAGGDVIALRHEAPLPLPDCAGHAASG